MKFKEKKSDTLFFDMIRQKAVNDDIIMIASHDEMTTNLRDIAAMYLETFGSKLSDQLTFRDHFVMVGQRGLKKGNAIESLTSASSPAAEINQCVSFPSLKFSNKRKYSNFILKYFFFQ